MTIPQVNAGIIGGSTTWSAKFPEDFPELGIKVTDHLDEIETPFGLSAPSKLLVSGDKRILYFGMHGCFPNTGEVIHL